MGTCEFEHGLKMVKRAIARDAPFEIIEHVIEELPGVDEELRAALWLIAWSGSDPVALSELLGRRVRVRA